MSAERIAGWRAALDFMASEINADFVVGMRLLLDAEEARLAEPQGTEEEQKSLTAWVDEFEIDATIDQGDGRGMMIKPGDENAIRAIRALLSRPAPSAEYVAAVDDLVRAIYFFVPTGPSVVNKRLSGAISAVESARALLTAPAPIAPTTAGPRVSLFDVASMFDSAVGFMGAGGGAGPEGAYW